MELALYFFGLVAIFSALRVITHNKPMHALLYLIITILAIAGVFFVIGAYFAGALEIIVYAGAVVVLFIFVVMMINIHCSEQINILRQPIISIIYFILPLILLLAILLYIFWSTSNDSINNQLIDTKTVGVLLFGPYILAVDLASMLLLAGLVVAFHLGYDAAQRR
ncbi:NADH-quinone oxidoreductase subunit J [Candidatus Palibaumannia cicadellinicola]|uniref:NADH-quinone oxidoreductase subunit J n=1 Tax=Baumannia cicadellinicola subsp. Homalodisca coagulata TaxID=374463 RepID=Q1LT97_BAUCH|nr:NADH-quinone oxidoreductase, chain J [Baumannia cicadellinicola str. Hc (Homalodisca coagulata)]